MIGASSRMCCAGWVPAKRGRAPLSKLDQVNSGFDPPYIEVTNPLVESERFLRSSMMPGLVRAVVYNTERRQDDVRLFEVGTVFRYPLGVPPPGVPAEGVPADPEGVPPDPGGGPLADAPERLSAIFAVAGDDAWTAAAAWRTIADALGIADWIMGEGPRAGREAAVLHPYRSASLSSVVTGPKGENGTDEHATQLGVVGELDPYKLGQFGLVTPDGRPRRVGWLDLDIGALLDRDRVPRRSEEARAISKFPSSDIDLAFVVGDSIPAGTVERTLRQAGGELLESVELFDVYRGPSVPEGSRSLAFHLRFSALDHTFTDQEISELRSRCIEAVEGKHQASLR